MAITSYGNDFQEAIKKSYQNIFILYSHTIAQCGVGTSSTKDELPSGSQRCSQCVEDKSKGRCKLESNSISITKTEDLKTDISLSMEIRRFAVKNTSLNKLDEMGRESRQKC